MHAGSFRLVAHHILLGFVHHAAFLLDVLRYGELVLENLLDTLSSNRKTRSMSG